MKKIIMITLFYIIFVSITGLGEEIKKDEVARKIAILTVQEKRIAHFFSLNLGRDSLGEIESRVNKILYTKYTIHPVPDSQIEGVRVYDLGNYEVEMDSISMFTDHPQHFVVAITDDLKPFRLGGFDGQTEFYDMIAHLTKSGISFEKNILPLSELFYCLEGEIWGIKMVSNPRQLKKALEKWDIEDLGGPPVDSIASRIKPASVTKKKDAWEVVFCAVTYSDYLDDYPFVRRIQVKVVNGAFKVVSDEEVF